MTNPHWWVAFLEPFFHVTPNIIILEKDMADLNEFFAPNADHPAPNRINVCTKIKAMLKKEWNEKVISH